LLKKVLTALKPLLLPLLFAVYPPLFHYGNNAAITVLTSLLRVLLFAVLFVVATYFLFLIFIRRDSRYAAAATFVFTLFFNTYGLMFGHLMKQDLIRIEHYTLLPLFIFVSLYVIWFMMKIALKTLDRACNILALIFAFLVVFNFVKILPYEVEKRKAEVNAYVSEVQESSNLANSPSYPDIYYIVLDEFSGFKPMREYWKYDGVDEFKQFLLDKNFFVAEDSHSSSVTTLYELATRLNYQEYTCCSDYRTYFAAIADNRVMQYLKSRGYTSVTFDQSGSAFPADIPVKADYFFERAPDTFTATSFFDEFVKMVIDNTMLRVFSSYYEPLIDIPYIQAHVDMLSFTQDRVKNLQDIPSPKFVYVHILLSHMPFVFDKNGLVIATTNNTNWNDYLGNYIYSIRYTKEMVTNILAQSDPKNPPVIILQSDHGARNQIVNGNEDQLLQDFPEEYKTSILFTLHIPGLDMTNLPQDVDPFNTFPILFKYLFNQDIPFE
jgi:hypothetical protein